MRKPPDAPTYLGRNVVGSATESFCCLVKLYVFLTHAKISDLDMPILIQQYIVQLQIAINNAAGMQEEQPDSDFGRIESGFCFREGEKGEKKGEKRGAMKIYERKT